MVRKIWKASLELLRKFRKMEISAHAAHACYFIVLSVFPMLVLVLGLLRYTHLEAADLMDLAEGLLPEALWVYAWKLISGAYTNTARFVISISGLTALWSAGKGIYGLMKGLDAVYGCREGRKWFQTRLRCAGYTVWFILVLFLTLGTHVFWSSLLRVIPQFTGPLGAWLDMAALRFFLLVGMQTLLFTLMFMKLPQKRQRFWESLPGALLGSFGWMTVSSLFSVYVQYFSRFSTIFGSMYAVALGMLWLYLCICIVLCGGVLNRFLKE